MTHVPFRLLRKNFGNLQEFLGRWFTVRPWQKIAPTPMSAEVLCVLLENLVCLQCIIFC